MPAAAPIGLVTVGDGAYGRKELALQLRTPVVAALPDDPATAEVLSNGGERHRGRLLRFAARAEADVGRFVAAGRARNGPAPAEQPVGRREVPSAR